MEHRTQSSTTRFLNMAGWVLCACLLLGGMLSASAQTRGAAGARATPTPGGPIILMGQLTIKAARVHDFVALFLTMRHRAQHEDRGNMRYELFTSAPMGAGAPSGSSRTFVFIEEWRNQADFAAHGKWAGPIVRSSWKAMSEQEQFWRLHRLPEDR